jgi:hypothetical protein
MLKETMGKITNRQIQLAARPIGEPKKEDLILIEEEITSPAKGQLLLQNRFLSLDPYMRGRMNPSKSYAKAVEVGEVMTGGTVGEVLESRHPDFQPGELVVGTGGWQEYSMLDGSQCRKVDPGSPSPSLALGVLGMPGVTAYTGLENIGKPQSGETLVVAAASGAVGAVVGQIAKIRGARAVGIAGSRDKCDYAKNELGFDECLNHRDPDLAGKLKEACPKGIDVYFENVGGAVFEAVQPLFNEFARIPVCGLISHYNDTQLPQGPNPTPRLMRDILVKRLTYRGFIVWDFASQEAEALQNLAAWIEEGRLLYREDFVDGLENAPEAFFGLLQGKNFGKLLVRLS